MRGEITILARCLMPEKLIDRATAQGARLDCVRLTEDNGLWITCDRASARQLLRLCQRYSIDARVVRRRGGSAARGFVRRRRTLAAGLLLGALLCTLFLSRLWIVDIAFTGENAALGEAAALSRALSALGVRPGVSRNIDTARTAQRLLSLETRYSYVGLRLQGVRLLVEAVPETPAPPVYELDAARDLVSALDGIVVSAVARSGEVCVKPGDCVRRGQLLIRGEEPSGQDATRPVAALGEVTVRSWVTGQARVPLARLRSVDTGRKDTGAVLTVLGRTWPLRKAAEYPSQRVDCQARPICGLFVPLTILRLTHIETRREAVPTPDHVLKAQAAALALADAQTALLRKGPETYSGLRRRVDYSYDRDALSARVILEIQSEAAVTREALQGG